MSMYLLSLILTPIITGVVGWVTNYIAVRMIFRPRKPVRVAGLTFWGLVPKRKSDLAVKIGQTIEKELISHEDIHAAINTQEFHGQLVNEVMAALDTFLERKLGTNPITLFLLSHEKAKQMKNSVKEEIERQLPGFMESMFEKMEKRIDFKEIIRKKIEEFDFVRFEQIIYSIAARELRTIEILGGVLGLIIGLFQVLFIVVTR